MNGGKRTCLIPLLAAIVLGFQRGNPSRSEQDSAATSSRSAFEGSKAGDHREVAGVELCWCPPGKFLMGSPHYEPERRPGEDQVEVTLTRGFWAAKFEVTQGQWRRVMGDLPGPLTAELPAGDRLPVGNV